jgi:hypothetical protein
MRTVWPFLLSRSVFAKIDKKLIFLVLKVRRFGRHVPVEQKSYKSSQELSFLPRNVPVAPFLQNLSDFLGIGVEVLYLNPPPPPPTPSRRPP